MLIRFFVLLAIDLDKVCMSFSIMLFYMVMQGTSFIVLGKIIEIIDEDGWWYTTCSCNKKVYADSNMYFVGTKGVSQVYHLSFDDNKVLKIINWIC